MPIPYALNWDVENRPHNRVGLLLTEAPYTKKYKAVFPWPMKRPGIYSTTLDKTDKDVVHKKEEGTHKAMQENWELYGVAEKETAKFFACAVPKTYLSTLCEELPMYMCDITAMTILAHLQKNTTGNHRLKSWPFEMLCDSITTRTTPVLSTSKQYGACAEAIRASQVEHH